MSKLWLLRGTPEAPGWKNLEQDARSEAIDVMLFDRDAWALLYADEAPTQYEGLAPSEPADGLYIDNNGRPCYVVGGKEARGPLEVIAALGEEAETLLKKIGDPDLVIERLGRSF